MDVTAWESWAETAMAFPVLNGRHHDYRWVVALVVLAKKRADDRGSQRR